MKFPHPYAISAVLFGAGAVAMALSAPQLANHEALDFPTNPLGIHRSPYGEVLAMAMQEPIDQFWHHREIGQLAPKIAGQRPNAEADPKPEAHPASCTGCHVCNKPSSAQTRNSQRPWNQRLSEFLESLDQASTARTNAVPSSPAHDRFIRGQVEDKLRFGYRLDPSHYGNYASYHFFLTEPGIGTRPILTPAAARLAQETIEYCLAEAHDPRPALTAAAAATNMLHLMFADQRSEAPIFSASQMRETLNLLDHCIARHIHIHKKWVDAGHDQLLSQMRILEMEERSDFVRRIRDAAEPAIARFEEEEAANANSKIR